MEMGPNQGYFPNPAKSLFISGTPGQEEASKRELAAEGLELNFFSCSWYLGSYLGPKEDLVAWVKTQVKAWAHRVIILGKMD